MKVSNHDGRFHADEVFAIAVLNLVHPGIETLLAKRPIERIKPGTFSMLSESFFGTHKIYFQRLQAGAGTKKNAAIFCLLDRRIRTSDTIWS